MKNKLLVILGHTASGKSELAVKLAREFNGELVSADSRQVYSEMDIATAKLKAPRGVSQWLVDVVRPDEKYNLKTYQHDAQKAIHTVHSQGKLPILVGGTAQYIDAVVEDWKIPSLASKATERCVLASFKRYGLTGLARDLKRLDPVSAATIDLANPRRVIRALSFTIDAGQSFVRARSRGSSLYDVLKIGLSIPSNELKERLRKRVEQMWRKGLVAETKKLLKKYSTELPSMSGIGYSEVEKYLSGELKKDKAIQEIVNHSYQYSRRQLTWWRRDREIKWVGENQLALAEVFAWIKIPK